MSDLDRRLLAAHEAGDARALVALYAQASETAADADAAAFYLTHAHVFALELGLPEAAELRQRLMDEGREAPLHAPRAPRR